MILNYLPYEKSKAIEVITKELGWVNYGSKHHESTYTKFFQAYILPHKFNIDKRRAHLSALIVTDQLSRDTALEEMKKPAYNLEQLPIDLEFVRKKFGLTGSQFDEIMNAPAKSFRDYRSHKPRLEKLSFFVQLLKRIGILPKRVGI